MTSDDGSTNNNSGLFNGSHYSLALVRLGSKLYETITGNSRYADTNHEIDAIERIKHHVDRLFHSPLFADFKQPQITDHLVDYLTELLELSETSFIANLEEEKGITLRDQSEIPPQFYDEFADRLIHHGMNPDANPAFKHDIMLHANIWERYYELQGDTQQFVKTLQMLRKEAHENHQLLPLDDPLRDQKLVHISAIIDLLSQQVESLDSRHFTASLESKDAVAVSLECFNIARHSTKEASLIRALDPTGQPFYDLCQKYGSGYFFSAEEIPDIKAGMEEKQVSDKPTGDVDHSFADRLAEKRAKEAEERENGDNGPKK